MGRPTKAASDRLLLDEKLSRVVSNLLGAEADYLRVSGWIPIVQRGCVLWQFEKGAPLTQDAAIIQQKKNDGRFFPEI